MARRHEIQVEKLQSEIRDLEKNVAEREEEKEILTYATIGVIVVGWSKIEHRLDLWISMIHMEWGSSYIQDDLPPSLDRELAYLKAAWKLRNLDDDLQRDGEKLLESIHRLKQFRHDLVHGELDVEKTDALVITTTKVDGPKRRTKTVTYTYPQLRKKSAQLGKLLNEAHRVVTLVAEAFVERQNVKREGHGG